MPILTTGMRTGWEMALDASLRQGLESFLSVDHTAAVAEDEFDTEKRSWIIETQELRRKVESLVGSTPPDSQGTQGA